MTIEIAPKILQHPSSGTVSLYSEVRLECVANGNPQPVVQWFQNEKRYFEGADADPIILVIPEMGPSNRGFFYCVASNTAGSVKSETALLNVYGMCVY